MPQQTSRDISLRTLLELESTKTPLPVLFDTNCKKHGLSGSDRAFAMRIIYGTIRQRDYLSYIIEQLCTTAPEKMHPVVRNALFIGLCQLFFMDNTPDSAAVNETVTAAKRAGAPKRLHGFVNGVLRESIRKRETLPTADSIYTLQPPRYNHPQWMIRRWQKRYQINTVEDICRYNNSQPALTLRIDTSKTERKHFLQLLADKNIRAIPGKYSDEAVLLQNFQGKISTLPGFDDGLFHVQGEAAQLATRLLGPFETDDTPRNTRGKRRFLDCCAGRGGKTSHLTTLLPCQAEITALEPEPHRFKLLAPLEKSRTHLKIHIFNTTLQKFTKTKPQLFDAVMVDAPCSGTGVLAKQVDIRWRRTPQDISRYAKIQYQLLATAASLVKPGGILLYITCSIEKEENMDNVLSFLQKNTSFTLSDPAPFLPESCGSLIKNSCFAPLPSQRIEGFFAARLVRT